MSFNITTAREAIQKGEIKIKKDEGITHALMRYVDSTNMNKGVRDLVKAFRVLDAHNQKAIMDLAKEVGNNAPFVGRKKNTVYEVTDTANIGETLAIRKGDATVAAPKAAAPIAPPAPVVAPAVAPPAAAASAAKSAAVAPAATTLAAAPTAPAPTAPAAVDTMGNITGMLIDTEPVPATKPAAAPAVAPAAKPAAPVAAPAVDTMGNLTGH